jgi:hypothetical protein
VNKVHRTTGEIIFEEYLSTQQLKFEFEKEHPGKTKRPDYTLSWNGSFVVCDVKDFDPPDGPMPRFGAFDPYPRIREKIEQGREKFKQFKEFACALVLFNVGNPLVPLYEPHIMLGSMYGNSGFTFPVNTQTGEGDMSKFTAAFLKGGKMLRPGLPAPQNTTISAIISLGKICPHYLRLLDMMHEYPELNIAELEAEAQRIIPNYDPSWEVPRVVVWHNAVARIPLSAELFCGSYDSHFGVVRDGEGVFQRVTFRGELLPKRLKV